MLKKRMKTYIKKFDTHSDFETFTESTDFILPNVSVCVNENEVHYHDYENPYLTFTAKQANSSIALVRKGTANTLTNAVLKYSTDDGNNWYDYTIGDTITLVNVGDSVKFKGENTRLGADYNNSHYFTMTGRISAKGDVTSLLNEIGGDCTLQSYAFYNLFSHCYTSLITAPNLPSTTLAESCYASMFYGCESLTTAPKLPATSLAKNCYASMFYGCASLTTAPELPATSLGDYCYDRMFNECTSLTTAPELPATTLKNGCYSCMFYRCSSLTTAPELPATALTDSCYSNMFFDCESLTTAPELPATTLENSCYASMFYGCTSLTTAPELPSTTLISRCYVNMFKNCSNLSYIKALFTTNPSTNYTGSWVNGVNSTGTFVKNSAANWTTTGEHGIPYGWTVQTANQ